MPVSVCPQSRKTEKRFLVLNWDTLTENRKPNISYSSGSGSGCGTPAIYELSTDYVHKYQYDPLVTMSSC